MKPSLLRIKILKVKEGKKYEGKKKKQPLQLWLEGPL